MADTNNTNNEEATRARGWLVLKHHMLTHKVGWVGCVGNNCIPNVFVSR